MLFMYMHTHTVEKCVADKPDVARKMVSQAQDAHQKADIKMIGSYVAPHEHTLYIIYDAPDIATLGKMILPMTVWGYVRLIPILTTEQTLTMAQ